MKSREVGENPVKIIRWSDVVTLPSGNRGYMYCTSGTMEEVKAFAQRIAEENGVTVEAVI